MIHQEKKIRWKGKKSYLLKIIAMRKMLMD